MKCHRNASVMVVALLLGAGAPAARADFLGDALIALAYTNFDVAAQHSVISGGYDVAVRNNFQGNPLDFGVAELTLLGPVSLEASFGGRAVREFDISFQTAVDSTQQSSLLSYLWDIDVGGQQSQVGGNLLIDGSFSINSFGFYELDLQYSSRQTVIREGRFANDEQDFDFDVGPVTIRGNIIADVLAVLTDPIFDATNTLNIFESFSGRLPLEGALNDARNDALSRLIDGKVFGPEGLRVAAIAIDALTGGHPGSAFNVARSRAVIPEPTVVVLMLLGAPLVLRRKRRRAR